MYELPNIEIPDNLPLSGHKGSKKLEILEKRRKFVGERIKANQHRPAQARSYDEAEYSALKWAIQQIILLEQSIKGREPISFQATDDRAPSIPDTRESHEWRNTKA
jgi:hypothetical protein